MRWIVLRSCHKQIIGPPYLNVSFSIVLKAFLLGIFCQGPCRILEIAAIKMPLNNKSGDRAASTFITGSLICKRELLLRLEHSIVLASGTFDVWALCVVVILGWLDTRHDVLHGHLQ